jgi:hypothetical protein
MASVVSLTFLFGLGNVWQLALRLGVPSYVAPLVAPAVDLSVLGLLVAIRELAVRGAPASEIRPARRLLLFASLVTLALNVAEPALAGNPGKAAFDAVGPLLLIGWSEVGPGLLGSMAQIRSEQPARITPDRPLTADPSDERTAKASVVPEDLSAEDPSAGEQTAVSVLVGPVEDGHRRLSKTTAFQPDGDAREQDLLRLARAEDVLHWQHHHRPISAETLGKRLRIGSRRARVLVAQLRSDTHGTLDEQGPRSTAQMPPSAA